MFCILLWQRNLSSNIFSWGSPPVDIIGTYIDKKQEEKFFIRMLCLDA